LTKRLLERDPLTGTERWFEYDPVEKTVSIRTIQDAEPILELNKALQTHDDGYSKTREWRRAASIPNSLIYQWLQEDGIDVFNKNHWPAVVRKLDSIEYRHLRTAPGQIGKRVRHM
jgi:hypothetical protein